MWKRRGGGYAPDCTGGRLLTGVAWLFRFTTAPRSSQKAGSEMETLAAAGPAGSPMGQLEAAEGERALPLTDLWLEGETTLGFPSALRAVLCNFQTPS